MKALKILLTSFLRMSFTFQYDLSPERTKRSSKAIAAMHLMIKG